jgi:uncharacterized membrane protein YfcA
MSTTDLSTAFLVLMLAFATVAGCTASIIGFGIGSLLTPILATQLGTDVAIAAVALPHLAGGVLRRWRLRHAVDRPVLVRFGILSAAGGLLGALAFARLAPELLTRALGLLLIPTASAGLTGWSQRWSPHGWLVWVLGALSGFFGGVVGNQGGLRAAALSAFGLAPVTFVATSTVIGVAIDLVRTPIYLNRTGGTLVDLCPLVATCVLGVLIGTLLGERLLFGLSRERFRVLVSLAVGALGLWFLLRPGPR